MDPKTKSALLARIETLERQVLESARVQRELEAARSELKRQNINLVRKSIELSDMMRELEDINYDLQLSKRDLEESRERFRSLIESTSDWVWEVDAQGVYTYASPKVSELLGYDPGEMIGRTPFSFMAPADRDRAAAAFEEAVRARSPIVRLENVNLHKDGRRVVLETSAVPILGPGGELLGYRGIDRDATETRTLQSQLIQAQKMEAIGQLAGGVAHDFNNLLTPILGLADLMLAAAAPGDPNVEDLEQIREAALRGQDLTRQILAFGRRQVLDMRVIRLGEVVASFEKTLRRTIREDIALDVSVTSAEDRVEADAAQVEQILLNLAANAQDAMPEGGQIRIRTRRLPAGTALSGADPTVGACVELELSDTGCGIEPEMVARVFEPFFTTKEKGRGTGLGLATVHGIVRQHGGSISVDSSPGSGTTFRMRFPATEKSDPAVIHEAPDQAAPATATILVVEDEPTVREVVCRILRANGYRVRSAEDADSCLKLVDRELPSFDLLVTDVIMPKTNGKELHRRLAERLPGLKVIFMSGYPEDVIASQGVLDDGTNFIQKPVSGRSLIPKVQQVLGA